MPLLVAGALLLVAPLHGQDEAAGGETSRGEAARVEVDGANPARSEPDAAPTRPVGSGFQDLVEVSEVFVDVMALDGDGQVVHGLGAGDFVIEEAGEPVEITSVSYHSTRYEDPALEAAAEGELVEVPSSRYFVFFFHDSSLGGDYGYVLLHQQVRAGRDAKAWVRRNMRPSDWVAVVGFDDRLRLYQDFTQDRESLRRAIGRAAIGKRPEPVRPSRRGERRELGILERLEEDGLREAETIYAGLETVARSLGYLVGRKSLVLFTVGIGESTRRGSRLDEDLWHGAEKVLNDHNVAIYPVDLSPPGRPPAQEEVLERIAEETGGFYDPNFSGFLDPIEDVAEESAGYYLITYRSERPAGEVGYQRIEVRAVDPSITVRARTGYLYGR